MAETGPQGLQIQEHELADALVRLVAFVAFYLLLALEAHAEPYYCQSILKPPPDPKNCVYHLMHKLRVN